MEILSIYLRVIRAWGYGLGQEDWLALITRNFLESRVNFLFIYFAGVYQQRELLCVFVCSSPDSTLSLFPICMWPLAANTRRLRVPLLLLTYLFTPLPFHVLTLWLQKVFFLFLWAENDYIQRECSIRCQQISTVLKFKRDNKDLNWLSKLYFMSSLTSNFTIKWAVCLNLLVFAHKRME